MGADRGDGKSRGRVTDHLRPRHRASPSPVVLESVSVSVAPGSPSPHRTVEAAAPTWLGLPPLASRRRDPGPREESQRPTAPRALPPQNPPTRASGSAPSRGLPRAPFGPGVRPRRRPRALPRCWTSRAFVGFRPAPAPLPPPASGPRELVLFRRKRSGAQGRARRRVGPDAPDGARRQWPGTEPVRRGLTAPRAPTRTRVADPRVPRRPSTRALRAPAPATVVVR